MLGRGRHHYGGYLEARLTETATSRRERGGGSCFRAEDARSGGKGCDYKLPQFAGFCQPSLSLVYHCSMEGLVGDWSAGDVMHTVKSITNGAAGVRRPHGGHVVPRGVGCRACEGGWASVPSLRGALGLGRACEASRPTVLRRAPRDAPCVSMIQTVLRRVSRGVPGFEAPAITGWHRF